MPLFFTIYKTTKRRAFWLSYLSGFLFFLLTLSWLTYVTLFGLIILCCYLAFYFAFFGYFFVGITKRTSAQRLSSIIFLSCFWVLLEYFRGQLLTGFPWVLLGYSQYRNLAFIQFADITGGLGVSFVVMFINLCVFVVLHALLTRNTAAIRKFVLSIFVVLVAVYGYGMYSMHTYSKHNENAPSLRVALLQGNVAQHQKWASIFRSSIKANYAALSQRAALDNPDLLIWPETSYPDYILSDDTDTFREIFEVTDDMHLPLLFGAVLEENDLYYNVAFLVSPVAQSIRAYKKIHLVPFGEYIPLRKYLHFLEDFIPIGDFESGNTYVIFHVNNRTGQRLHFGTLICFEDTLAELSRQFRLRGADFLVNITNDAWFGESANSYQHLQASVFRAIENRAYVVRAANTGISCIIDSAGRIVKRVKDSVGKDIFVRGFIQGEIKKSDVISFYTRFGDIFVMVCMVYILLFSMYLRKKM